MTRILALFALCALPLTPATAQDTTRPVMVGGSTDFDACAMVGQMRGFDPRAPFGHPLRAAPSEEATKLGRLRARQMLWICEAENGWLGVVIIPKDRDRDCGVSSPIAVQEAYAGPCRAGWLPARLVTPIAG